MKKILASMVLIFCIGICLSAQEAKVKKQNVKAAEGEVGSQCPSDWDFFELAFFPGIPSYTENSVVYGMKLGLPVSDGRGEVSGLELAVFSSMTDNINGVQMAPFFTYSQKMNGFQFAPANVAEKTEGVQLGLVNYSKSKGFQIGLVNIIKDGKLPFFPIINFAF